MSHIFTNIPIPIIPILPLFTPTPTNTHTTQPRDEPSFTRGKVHEFLTTHTAYELIPESGKVVVLDVELPIRQAFHALHEQGIASAPLWDPRCVFVCVGVCVGVCVVGGVPV